MFSALPFRPSLLGALTVLTFWAIPTAVHSQTSSDVIFANSQGVLLSGKLYRSTWSGSRPAVVLMHGCAGIYSYSDPSRGIARLYTEWADRLTKAGYAALLIDSFGPRGVPQNQCGNGAVGVSEVSDRPNDAYAGLAFLASRPLDFDAHRVAVMGWSHGGSSALSTLSTTSGTRLEGRFRGAFAFYPGCGLYNAFNGIPTSTYVPYAPLLIFHGDVDPLYTAGYCQTRLSRAVALGASSTNGNPIEMTVYRSAKHSFDNARRVGDEFTIYDVNAKTTADAEVMSRLPDLLH